MAEGNRQQSSDSLAVNDEQLLSRVQTFVMCAIGLALAAGPVGFEYGAYGKLFFTRIYLSWFLVTAAFLSMAMLPREYLPFPKTRLIYLLVPSLWVLVRLLVPINAAEEAVFPVLFVLGMVSYLLCLPYAAYLLVTLLKPELINLPGTKPKIGLVIIFVFFLVVGYIFGSNHPRLLTCEDFEVSGSSLPESCTSAEQGKL